ncbi:hypothetical protein [Roseomonas sp. BN140053]|uniref:hypothetical protein n=1 Tax=Roseomonas sp. BN140053 TaxID=3391898 RepID=UPI0039E7BA7B
MTVVVIWNNNLAGTQTYIGHAAMLIGDRWSPTKPVYVSYWPEDSASLVGKETSFKAKNFLSDLVSEGYAPDHVIKINGLNKAAMQAEWDAIRLKQNSHYQMVRKNCSTIVARVLKKGAKTGSFGMRHNAIWTPLKVKRLAFEMLGTEMGWSWMVDEARMDNLISQSEATMLKTLRKRDARHGKASGTASYYVGGKAIVPKVALISTGYGAREGFAINGKLGRAAMYADGGDLLGGHVVNTQDGMEFSPD